MVTLASAPPVVRHANITLPHWRRGEVPLTIVLLSDFHVSTPGDSPERLRETVATVNSLRPDIVLLAGDFSATGIVGARKYGPRKTVAPLGKLRPNFGVYAVLGNHDYDTSAGLVQAISQLKIRILDNAAVRVGPLALIGVADDSSGHADVGKAIASWHSVGGVPIAFTHSPDVIPLLPQEIHLALAGHTHCGQVNLPLFGALITHSRYGKRYACGLKQEGLRTVVITAGLGTSTLPIRLGATPDLWVIRVGGNRVALQHP